VPRAFITGITGQDGQHLAEFLHGRGYDVYGMVKGQSNPRIAAVLEEMPFIETVPGDLADLPSLVAALSTVQPDEVYNLGAISFVALSFNQAELTANITGLGVLRMLEAIRMVGGTHDNPIRFYQASSSEMFGKVRETPQTERTPFHPRSPYGCAKVFGHDIVVNYRESYGLYACSGILFNHEGPRRGFEFVTRKVSNAVARIKLGLQHELVLGNMDTKRDWGYAGDYVKAMWLMLQQDEPDDYVIATGETHSVQEFVERAFAEVGIENWQRLRPSGSEVPAARRGRPADRRRDQGPHPARVGARGGLRGARVDDGAPRPPDRGRQGRHHPLTSREPGSALERHVGDGVDQRAVRRSAPMRQLSPERTRSRSGRRPLESTSPISIRRNSRSLDSHVPSRNTTTPMTQPRATSAWPRRAITACAVASAAM
jgi:GDPmannose 4,6-dehydratase